VVAANRLFRLDEPRSFCTFISKHLLGVLLPGDGETLIHWYQTLEEAANQCIIDPIVADLDMRNFFNSVE
jgi:hypothetical protein